VIISSMRYMRYQHARFGFCRKSAPKRHFEGRFVRGLGKGTYSIVVQCEVPRTTLKIPDSVKCRDLSERFDVNPLCRVMSS